MNFKDLVSHYCQKSLEAIQKARKVQWGFNGILAILALGGILSGFFLVYMGLRPPRTSQPITPPAASSFKNFIAGSGIIESKSENIQLGTLVGGIVDKIHVKVGDKVKAGQPLFSLDNRQAQNDFLTQQATLAKAKAVLGQLKASLKDTRDKYGIVRNIEAHGAISRDDFLTRQNAFLVAQKAYEAGQADVAVAQATLKRSQTNLDILTVKAPIECKILKINVHPGEYAQPGPLATPLMLIGNVSDRHVRIDIDETDAWRFSPGAPAIAFLRGNSAFRIELEFDHLEPFILPKTSLTGNSAERVDVRVLQPIYRFKNTLPVAAYIGQQVDVFIEVPEALAYDKFFPPTRVNP